MYCALQSENMDILVGYSGFVGSNLCTQHKFTMLLNSKNIFEAFGTAPDMCVYAGVRAEKFVANTSPEKDYAQICEAIENIKQIQPKQLVLISTVDVYKNPAAVSEADAIDTEGLHPYGLHRYALETWVRENINKHLIIRLPGLFGKNIRKNFIYDLITMIPSRLNELQYQKLAAKDGIIKNAYIRQDNVFYVLKLADDTERLKLKFAFEHAGFSALCFTDSRGVFQFYNLDFLWRHIQIALANKLKLVNFATEPLSVKKIYAAVKGGVFHNEIAKPVPCYDFRTEYASIFGGAGGYIFDKHRVLKDICTFVDTHKEFCNETIHF
jgi:hypothetical protein